MDMDIYDTVIQLGMYVNLVFPGGYHTVPVNTISSLDTSYCDG